MPANMLPNFQPSRFRPLSAGASISFDSALSVADDAPVSTVIAQASVNGQDGPHTFTLTNDASGQFAITTGGELSVAAALTAGLQGIEISADNGVDDPVVANRSVLVTVSPANSVAPVVSGTPEVGATLTTTDGTWTGEPAPTFTYQWQRDGVNISGATASTYVLVDADDGTDVECDVTADNGINTATAASNALSITYPTPVFTTAATISTQNVVGQTLTATPGVVDPPSGSGSTISYQWTRDASNIAAATSSAYTLVSADENTDVTCVVTATTNNPGTPTATSTPTAVTVLYIAPTLNGSIANKTDLVVGTAGTQDVSSSITGNGLTWSLDTAPAGVTISSVTGIITYPDTLTEQTASAMTVRATNNGGAETQSFTITVAAAGSGYASLQAMADDIFTGGRTGILIAPGEADYQETGAQTTASAADDVVGSIVSLDPTGGIVTAPADAQRPTLVTDSGNLVYSFAGTGDNLVLLDPPASGTHTIAIAIKMDSSENLGSMFSGNDASNPNKYAALFNDGSASAEISFGAGTPSFEVDGVDSSTNRDVLHTNLSTGGWVFFLIEDITLTGWDVLRFNNDFNLNSNFDFAVKVGPALVVDDTLTAQELTDVENAIMAAVTP